MVGVVVTKTESTFTAQIYVAGPIEKAKDICAEYCLAAGLCVTVTPTEFIYTGGREQGVVVGLVNYPKFPVTPEDLRSQAELLAKTLVAGLHQQSALIVMPDKTVWFTSRPQ